MAQEIQTSALTLDRNPVSTGIFRHFRGTPLRLMLTQPGATAWDDCTELRVEIHSQRTTAGQTPLAATSIASPTGITVAADFSTAQLAIPATPADRPYWILVRAIWPTDDPEVSNIDVYHLGRLMLFAHPSSDIDVPPEVVEIMAPLSVVNALAEQADEIASDLTDETNARELADTSLQNQINAKAAATDLTDEINARELADTSLQNQINAKAAATDLTDEESARQSGDDALQEQIAGITATVQTALPVEDYNQILVYGQSLSVGADAMPPLSVLQIFDHVTWNVGPNVSSPSGTPGYVPGFAALIEKVKSVTQGETPCSGIAAAASDYLSVSSAGDRRLFVSTAGRGSSTIAILVKGQAWYAYPVEHMTLAHSFADTAGVSHGVHAIVWIQGESDASAGTDGDTYLAALRQLRSDLSADAQAATDQAYPVSMLTYQTAAYAQTTDAIALAQLRAAEVDPYIQFVTPIYHLPHVSNIHLTNIGSHWLGRYFGRAYARVAQGLPTEWIRPLSATAIGTLVTVRFDVPKAPLVIDAVNLPATTQDGFEITDGGGTLTISNVAIGSDGTSVELTIDRQLQGNPAVRYALDHNGTGIINGASGSLRDSTADTWWLGGVERPLWHVCPMFELSIEVRSSDVIGVELTSFDHWLLRDDSGSLAGRVHSEALTLVAGAAAPTYGADFISMPGHISTPYTNGLDCDIVDTQDHTVFIVVKKWDHGGETYAAVAGTCKVTAAPYGVGLLQHSGNPAFVSLQIEGSTGYSMTFPPGAVAGDWLFIAYSYTDTQAYGLMGGGGSFGPATHGAPARSGRKIALGNAYVPFSNSDVPFDVAEFGVFDRALNLTELQTLYAKAKARMAMRGITVL